MRGLILIASALILFSFSVARADDIAAAKEHYKKGTTAYDLGHYVEAANEYEAAFRAKDEPALLFNIAQAYRLAGDHQSAIRFYRSYLRRVPNASTRPEVEARILDLQKVIEQEQRTKDGPPQGTIQPDKSTAPGVPPGHSTEAKSPAVTAPIVSTPPAVSTVPPPVVETTPKRSVVVATATHRSNDRSMTVPGRSKKIAGIALFAVAGVALVGGIVSGVLASQAADAIHAEVQSGSPFDPSRESAGKTDNIVSGVMYGVAGAAAVAGSVLFYLGVRESRAASRNHLAFTPMLAPGVGGAILTVGF